MSLDHKFEFKHFAPITNTKGSYVFPLGVSQVDFNNLRKNIPHFQELAVSAGLGLAKGAILKNTFKFFQPNDIVTRKNLRFPTDLSATMIGKDAPLVKVGDSALGTPVFSNLQIKGGSYKDNFGNTIGVYDDIRIDAVILEVTNDNNLVTEDLQGRNGTIIEYISSKSYMINCKGRILSPSRNTYPYTDVKNLAIALDSNKSLQVTSWFLNMFGIYNIVIKNKHLPQEEGVSEWQRFEFDAIADKPVILKLKK
jgi:hypothetical protein